MLLKPHFETLVSSFAFPQLCFTAEKQELWRDDTNEYLRSTFGTLISDICLIGSYFSQRSTTITRAVYQLLPPSY